MSHPQTAPNVLSFPQAQKCVEEHAASVAKPQIEAVSLLASNGRILAEPLTADRDFPPFPRSTRDGYAVRSSDVASIPAQLKLMGQIKAGQSFDKELHSGECVEIMTGAPVPAGADAVVMVEFTGAAGDTIRINRSVAPGENVVPKGSEAKSGQIILEAGIRLTHAQIAIAAAVGKSKLGVYAQPRISILPTGDEIVDIGQAPGPNQIRNSNSYSLAAQVENAGGQPLQLPVAPDEKTNLRDLTERGLEADLLVLSGGVSMGKYDLVEQVLAELGAEFYFTGAKIQPGKPVVFGKVRGKYFFGLPGNPVSTMVTFELFVRPMIEALGGAKPSPLRFAQAALKREFKTKTGLTRFLPAILSGGPERPEVELVAWQGSGDIAAMSKANCYLVIPEERESLAAGESVSILLA